MEAIARRQFLKFLAASPLLGFTSAGRLLAEETLDFLLWLYRIFAEYRSIRLRVTNDELVAAKKKIKHLISKL